MIMSGLLRLVKVLLLVTLAVSLSGCEQPQVYGSIGYSSYGGSRGGGGMGGSISVGGRIF
jgi:hypothetical protein